jgi:small multidrug resistance family-3 protein
MFVAGSLLWAMAVDRFRPDRWDLTGVAGVEIIRYAPGLK